MLTHNQTPLHKMVFYQRNHDALRPSRRLCNLALTVTGVVTLLIITYKLQLCKLLLMGLDLVIDSDRQTIQYDRNMPLIFISALPNSGAGLLRALLDAHPDVRCSDDIFLISLNVELNRAWPNSEEEKMSLEEAGVSKDILHSAMAAFCLEVFALHGEAAPRLCYKDPLMLLSADYMTSLFPQGKYLFVVRDGRASVHSSISQEMPIKKVNASYYREHMSVWNKTVSTMYNNCNELGDKQCMMVYYEQLVLHPVQWMRQILSFLDLPWHESVLHPVNHGGLQSTKTNSSDAVLRGIHIDSLNKWVGNIPVEVMPEMDTLAPMLATLGYDFRANPPNYGTPDALSHASRPIVRDQILFW